MDFFGKPGPAEQWAAVNEVVRKLPEGLLKAQLVDVLDVNYKESMIGAADA